MKDYKDKRIGEINYNKHNKKMIIIDYKNANEITILFPDDNYKTITSYQAFKKREVANPFDKTIFNVGFLGVGDYKTYENNNFTKEYLDWKKIMRRGYDIKQNNDFPTYKDVFVCEDWHNFQEFAKWHKQNYYEVSNEQMHLDKDILCKGNKIYSPDNCCFVPARINGLLLKSNKTRGRYPIGVCFHKNIKKFSSLCNDGHKQIHLGYYNSPDEAFYVYKNYKEKLIKQVAEQYKDNIPNKLYEALINYKVEITD